MKILKAYKYRLRPNRKQLALFSQFAGCARFVFNKGLERRKEVYENENRTLRYFDQNKEVTKWKKELPWLSECHSQVLQQSLKDLDRSFTHFFRRLKNKEIPGFPKFKKKGIKDSFRYPQGFKVAKDTVYLPKIGHVRFRKSREIQGEIKEVTVIREADKWFVSFSLEIETKDPESVPFSKEKAIGIDLGCHRFATMALDHKQIDIPHPKFLNNFLDKLRYYSKQLSRKKYKSKNYYKFKKKLARLHLRIRNARADFLHKLSTKLVHSHDVICVESLHVKKMLEEASKTLARKIADSGWRTFLSYLHYKAHEIGKHLKEIDPFYPSSQLCSKCHQRQKLALSTRTFKCPNCGLEIDRDFNAAINIKAAGTSVLRPVELAYASVEAGISRL